MGIAAVQQTYAWEGSAASMAHTWDLIVRLDALDARLGDAESSASRLAASYSPDEALRCRTAVADATQIAAAAGSADIARLASEEVDAIRQGLRPDTAGGMADALTSTQNSRLSERAHQAIRRMSLGQRRMMSDRLNIEKSIVRLARSLLELTSALSLFTIGLLAWQSTAGSKRLSVKEEQYRQVVEMAGDIICRTDRHGRIEFCNPTALTMLHLTEDEVVGRSWLKLLRHDKRGKAKRFYLRQFARRVANTYYEFPVIDGHGRERWVGQNVQLLSAHGEPAFQAIAREITERKHAEYELEKSRSFVERIAASTPGILFVYDLDEHRNVYSNREIVSVLGYKPEGALRVHPEDVPALGLHRDALREAFEGEVRRIEYRVQHADGRWIWLSSCDTPFERARGGQVSRIVGIAQDITSRKAHDEKLRQRADYDSVTGLANRHRFRRLLEDVLRRAAIEQSPVCFCIVDIDRFRHTIDRHGGAAADEVLRAAGQIVRSELRDRDAAGRLGGDQIGLILPRLTLPEAADIAERIRAAVEKLRFGAEAFSVTVKSGIAEWQPQTDLNQLMEAAERALYRARPAPHPAVCAPA